MVLAKGAMGEEPAYPHLELLEKGTDWFDEIFRLDSVRNYQIGLSGGAENVSYNLSVGFFQQKGVIKRNEYHRLTLRANNEYRPWEKVTIGHNLSAAFSLKSNDDPAVVGQAYRLSPTIKPYNEEGDFSDSQNSSTGNPLATIAYLNNNTRDDRVTGNAHLTWEVIEDLSFRISFGIDLLNRREWIFRYEFYVYSTYQKLALKAGETRNVEFLITPETISMYNLKMEYGPEPGDFKVWIAANAEDESNEGLFSYR